MAIKTDSKAVESALVDSSCGIKPPSYNTQVYHRHNKTYSMAVAELSDNSIFVKPERVEKLEQALKDEEASTENAPGA